MTPSNTETVPCDCTTSETGCQESALSLKISQFEADIDLAHQIVHGDPVAEVLTEGGLVPSFANVISRIRGSYQAMLDEMLHSMQGTVAFSYSFEKSMVWHIVHNLNCVNFDETIRNIAGQRVYAHVEPINENELLVKFTEPEEGVISVVFFKQRVDADTIAN